jgi:formiminoglutamase
MSLSHIFSYLEHPETNKGIKFNNQQLGAIINSVHDSTLDFDQTHICIVGCGENRGSGEGIGYVHSADLVRDELYQSYYWHKTLNIVDFGNVIQGKTADDSRVALQEVLSFIHEAGKIAVVIGGSHDLTIAQYNVYKKKEQIIDITIADMLIDLTESEAINSNSYLYDLLTQTPNFIKNLSLLGFQSYYANPKMVDMLSKLHFDCYRLGRVRDDLNDIEPILRKTNLLSIDINVVKHSDAPANVLGSPNGLHGDEVCFLTKYAGMSEACNSFGIFGYNPDNDHQQLTAKLIANMIWYFLDGVYLRMSEIDFTDESKFNKYHVSIDGHLVQFSKSLVTNRWWMQLPNKQMLPCTYNDYLGASTNQVPERWIREIEKSI